MNGMAEAFAPKSDQITADDLLSGPMVVKILDVKIDLTRPQQKVDVFLVGKDRAFRPCKTVGKILMNIWGDADKWVGQSMRLFRDPTVKWSGAEVGGVRVSHVTGIDAPVKVTVMETRTTRKAHTIQPLTITDPIASAPTTPDNAIALCEAAAGRGTEAFRAWWGSDEGKACRPVAQANIEALKAIASAADPAPDQGDDEPPM